MRCFIAPRAVLQGLFLSSTRNGAGARYTTSSLRARQAATSVRYAAASSVCIVPGEPIAAPSGVSVAPILSAFSDAEVRWTDNSDNETAFDVQILLDGEPIQQRSV